MPLKIALVQMPVFDDKRGNIARAKEHIRRAADRGAKLVVLPEMFNCPYSNDYFGVYAEEAGGETHAAMSRAAADAGVYLVAGSIPERDAGRLYNTCFVFADDGREIAKYRKMHMFAITNPDGTHFDEGETLASGQDLAVFDTEFGRMGVVICFDMRFPELMRLTALAGARMVIVPAVFSSVTGPAHWEVTLRARAIDNQIFTVGVCPARHEKSLYNAYGNSLVSDPWGTVLARAGFAEELVIADVDLDEIERTRCKLELIGARRTDVYELRLIMK